MKHPKFVALATALTMVLSPMSVFATELTPGTDESISGTVNYVNTTKYQVTLPTTTGMTFALDPQGLTSLDGGAYDGDAAGAIVATGTMTAVNESSVDLTLKSSFYVVDSTGTLKLVGSDATVNDDNQEIMLTIQSDGDGTGTTYTDVATITSQSATAPTVYEATMDKATYEFTGSAGSYEYTLTADTGSKLNMKIAGSVAKNYDWSAYSATTDPATIELHAVFEFVDPTADTVSDDYVITVNPDGTASYAFVSAPTGTLSAVKDGETDRSPGITSNNITYADGVLTFSATAVTNWLASTTNDVTVTIGDEVLTFTVVNDYVLDVSSGTMSYTFPSGTAPTDAISAVTSDIGTHTAGISSNNITYDPSTGTLTFTATAVTNWASKVAYVDCTFGTTTVHFIVTK